MEEAKSKPLSSLVFIPLLALIFLRPFLSGLAYPVLENYSQNCLITLAIIALFFNRKERVRNPYGLAIALLMLSYLVSAAFSVNIRNSISEIIKFISYLSLFFLVSQGDEKQRKITIKTIVIAASIISLYSIYQYFVGYQHTLDYLEKIKSDFLLNSSYARDILIDKRAIGTFPSPNLLGGYLIVCFFLSLVLIKNNMLNKKWYIAPFLIIVALILTKSMGAWLSLISGIIILFLLSYKYLKQRRLILALSSIVIISVLAFILISRWERLGNIENPQNSITQRLNYWRTAIAIIKDRPITGVGPGNFKEVFLNYKVGLSTDARYAHNILLHQWAETGVFGLIGLIYLIIVFLKKFKLETKNIFALLAGFSFILHNLIDNTYFIPQAGMLWWILLGLII